MANTANLPVSLGAATIALLRSLSKVFFDRYRPELHYMRGPGPKWREKHEIAASRPGLAATPASLKQREFAAQMVTTCR